MKTLPDWLYYSDTKSVASYSYEVKAASEFHPAQFIANKPCWKETIRTVSKQPKVLILANCWLSSGPFFDQVVERLYALVEKDFSLFHWKNDSLVPVTHKTLDDKVKQEQIFFTMAPVAPARLFETVANQQEYGWAKDQIFLLDNYALRNLVEGNEEKQAERILRVSQLPFTNQEDLVLWSNICRHLV